MITKNPFEKRSYFIAISNDSRSEFFTWLHASGVTHTMANGQIWFKTDNDELMFLLRWL